MAWQSVPCCVASGKFFSLSGSLFASKVEWSNEAIFQRLLLGLLFLVCLLSASRPAGQFEPSAWGILTAPPPPVGLTVILLLLYTEQTKAQRGEVTSLGHTAGQRQR